MSRPLRVLAMDHFFNQDLSALAAHPGLEVRTFPYQRLRNPAVRMMGRAVATGLREYTRAELAPARARFSRWLGREVRRLYLEQPFDVLVLPSDTFFYVRDLPLAAHALGLPVVVVQKETTISVDTMRRHSALVGEMAPMVADHMTVCSERHREFWLRSGADPELVEVTGQPRFDIYAAPCARQPAKPRQVLFLTYLLDAYVPAGGDRRTWEPLRDDTESALLEGVRAGELEVVVKCHPQQDQRAEAARLARRAGSSWNRGISIAPPGADTRQLVVDSDLVVGFQTTALYESVAARRTTVYAAWGAEYERHRSHLIPFEEAPSACLHHARSSGELAALLAAPPAAPSGCAAWYEQALGPVDGRATERVAARLIAIADAWPETPARRELERGRRRFAAGLLVRSLAAEAVWSAGLPVAARSGQLHRVAARRQRAQEGRRMAIRGLRRSGTPLNRGGG